jgi:hypothetical protein
LPEEQAAPEETAMPSRSKAMNAVSAFMPSTANNVVFGRRPAASPKRTVCGEIALRPDSNGDDRGDRAQMSRKLNPFGTKVPLGDRIEHVRPPTDPELPRRMTQPTIAFSKKAANHAHMMAIYFMHYNFVRIHQTFKNHPGDGRWGHSQALGNV